MALIALTGPCAYAQSAPCLDSVQTDAETAECARLSISPIEAQIDEEFGRVATKYKDNKDMQEILRSARQSWNGYRNVQCLFEAAAAADGRTSKPLPFEANRAYLKCAFRTALQMQAALSKL